MEDATRHLGAGCSHSKMRSLTLNLSSRYPLYHKEELPGYVTLAVTRTISFVLKLL